MTWFTEFCHICILFSALFSHYINRIGYYCGNGTDSGEFRLPNRIHLSALLSNDETDCVNTKNGTLFTNKKLQKIKYQSVLLIQS